MPNPIRTLASLLLLTLVLRGAVPAQESPDAFFGLTVGADRAPPRRPRAPG